MKCYDKDGDYINPRNGLAGLVLTDENASRQKRIISIPESSKDEMFEQTKKEFLQENGVVYCRISAWIIRENKSCMNARYVIK